MKKHLLIIIVFIFIGRNATSQNPMIKLDESKKVGSTSKSHTYTMQLKGEIHTPTSDLKWKPTLSKKIISSEPQEPNAELIEKIKAEKLLLKTQTKLKSKAQEEKSIEAFTPIVGTNYLGNLNTGFSPLDNNIAISNGGIIVSVSNDVIECDDMSGTNLYYNDLVTFIKNKMIFYCYFFVSNYIIKFSAFNVFLGIFIFIYSGITFRFPQKFHIFFLSPFILGIIYLHFFLKINKSN